MIKDATVDLMREMEIKIASCSTNSACRPKTSFLYANSDGFEIEKLPGDYEYYIGTLIAALRTYGLSPSPNFDYLTEIAVVVHDYIQEPSFDSNRNLKEFLVQASREIMELMIKSEQVDEMGKKERMRDILEGLNHLLLTF